MSTHRRTIRILAAVCCLAGSVVAVEASAQQSLQDFTATDRNHNNAIDRNEYRERMVEVFYLADRNKDGYVTIEELEIIEKVDSKTFHAADTNGDGKLTIEEFIAYRMRDFDAADKNHDGTLSVEEVETFSAPLR